MSRITHTQFSMQVSFLAKEASSWAADCLTLPEEHGMPMLDEPMNRFLEGMRERLRRIEQWQNADSHEGEKAE